MFKPILLLMLQVATAVTVGHQNLGEKNGAHE
jgi:hypothetical protein